jgi:hypothetical protein
MTEQNSKKFVTGLFIGLGVALFVIALYDLIGRGKFNASATAIGLFMFFLAHQSRKDKKESKSPSNIIEN